MLQVLNKVTQSVSNFFEINQATLSGAIDILVVEQEDGSLACSPFHVRFGKLKVLKTNEKEVGITVNGINVPIRMKLGREGEAFFEMKEEQIIVEEDMSMSRREDLQQFKLTPEEIMSPEIRNSNLSEKLLPEGSVFSKFEKEKEKSQTKVSGHYNKNIPGNINIQKNLSPKNKSPKKESNRPSINESFNASLFNKQEAVEYEPDVEMSLCKKYIEGLEDDMTEIFDKFRVSYSKYSEDPISILSNPDLMIKIQDNVYDLKVSLPIVFSILAFKRPLPEKTIEDVYVKLNDSQPERESMSKEEKGKFMAPMNDLNFNLKPDFESVMAPPVKKEKGKFKTLRPTSEMLKSMNLKPGCNTITYNVHSSLQGDQAVHGYIYFWSNSSKIVISDVDGTITKSDVLGNILPHVGRDWSHPGVASLYKNIVKNGYNILYLTSRAIGQSETTRNYLTGLQQEGLQLPPGPIIMSPDRLMNSFKREVVLRQPELYKIIALKDIKRLFSNKINPFISGFGNRETDAIAYRAVGIPMSKIFIINPKGEVHQLNNTITKSYNVLNDLVEELFPPLDDRNDKYRDYLNKAIKI